jgi:hypothetical protein
VFLQPLGPIDDPSAQAQAAVEQQERDATPFAVRLLAEIERQLDTALKLDAVSTPPAAMSPPQTVETLLPGITFKLSRFSDVYLVVDQLDCLWALPPGECLLVEEQLQALREAGARVLVTSRTPFRRPMGQVFCDVEAEEHDMGECLHDEENNDQFGRGLTVCWTCEDHDKMFVMCETCRKAGYQCNAYVLPTPLSLFFQPPSDCCS